MPRWTETWLLRPGGIAGSVEQPRWPGEKLGLPESGVRSAAGGGARLLAFLLDLLAAALIAALFRQPDLSSVPDMQAFNNLSVGIWVLITVPAAAFFGFTPGMAVVGIRVARLDGSSMVGVVRAIVRCLLTVLLLPPIVRNADGRGWHDRATGTVVIRMR